MAKQAPEIIAFHLGWDVADVSEGRYQRYTNPSVYVCGEAYYCAPTAKQKLPADVCDEWVEDGTQYGRKIYKGISK